MRVDLAHKNNAIDFCSALSIGHPQRLTCLGCGFGSGSIFNLASETASWSNSARARGCFSRTSPSESPTFQMFCSESPSLQRAEIFRIEGSGRKAPCFGFDWVLLKWLF